MRIFDLNLKIKFNLNLNFFFFLYISSFNFCVDKMIKFLIKHFNIYSFIRNNINFNKNFLLKSKIKITTIKMFH